MKLLNYGLFLAALALLTPTLSANDERRAVVAAIDAVAIPATSPIVIDGKLNEEIWQTGAAGRRLPAARSR